MPSQPTPSASQQKLRGICRYVIISNSFIDLPRLSSRLSYNASHSGANVFLVSYRVLKSNSRVKNVLSFSRHECSRQHAWIDIFSVTAVIKNVVQQADTLT